MTTSTVPLPVYPPDAEPARQLALYHRGEPRPMTLRIIPNDWEHEQPTHLIQPGDVPRWYAIKAGHSTHSHSHPIAVAATHYTDPSRPPDLALVLSDIRRSWRDWRVSPRCEVCLVFSWLEIDASQAYWTDRRERRQAS